jgi:hypothetical protein
MTVDTAGLERPDAFAGPAVHRLRPYPKKRSGLIRRQGQFNLRTLTNLATHLNRFGCHTRVLSYAALHGIADLHGNAPAKWRAVVFFMSRPAIGRCAAADLL